MKKIGLVGGTGPESTLMYYKELNSRIDAMTNGANMPEVAIESVNFRKAWEYMINGSYEDLTAYLSEKIKALQAGGAEVISLTSATVHVVFDELEKQTGVSLVSIPRAVAAHAVEKGYKKVGLIGTSFTMEKDYMKKDLIDSGIEVIIPDEEERELVARKIFEELEFGIVKESTLDEFNLILKRMKDDQKIEAVILGCTELPLLLNDQNCCLPCIDSVDAHIRKLIELSMWS